ncbi:MAG: tail fiber domain-containing protein [Chloroflexi bacterium]|nr:tail fiber domain-containing protein [Chloroflexota bacterium]
MIGGGSGNAATGAFAVVGGGDRNTAADFADTVGGGEFNSATGAISTVAGGLDNTAGGFASAIGGGEANTAFSDYSTIGGGEFNSAIGFDSTVGGGDSNTAGGTRSTVAGGGFNNAGGVNSAIGGGRSNSAAGFSATVPGGESNVATGNHSIAAGFNAQALHSGANVWADSTGAVLASAGVDEYLVRASGGVMFWSDAAASTGVQLAPGSGSWSSLSDRNAKMALGAVDPREILERLAQVEISTYSYKTQDGVRHIGPMAQDFAAAFNVGENNTTISVVDADGVALAAIQGLFEIVLEKEAQIAAMQDRLAALEGDGTATLGDGTPAVIRGGLWWALAAATALVAGFLVFAWRVRSPKRLAIHAGRAG